MNEEFNPLAEFGEEYDGINLPEEASDGKYIMCITKFDLKETENTKEPLLAWSLQILNADKPYTQEYKTSLVRSGQCMEFLKKDLVRMGYKGSIPQLFKPEVRMDFIHKCLRVTKATKTVDGSPKVNLWINGVAKVDNVEELLKAAQGGDGAAASNNVPF